MDPSRGDPGDCWEWQGERGLPVHVGGMYSCTCILLQLNSLLVRLLVVVIVVTATAVLTL